MGKGIISRLKCKIARRLKELTIGYTSSDEMVKLKNV